MAKQKTRPGLGSKLHPIQDYRNDEYVPYIFNAESGILQAWAIEPDLRDGDVREALRGLISSLKKTEQLPEILAHAVENPPKAKEVEVVSDSRKSLVTSFILHHLALAFNQYGALDAKDVAGVLRVINSSVGAWNTGTLGQGYLNYIKGFLANMNVTKPQKSTSKIANFFKKIRGGNNE